MRHNPTDSEIKRLALAMLQQGLLVSELPAALTQHCVPLGSVDEFNLSREKARRLTSEVVKGERAKAGQR